MKTINDLRIILEHSDAKSAAVDKSGAGYIYGGIARGGLYQWYDWTGFQSYVGFFYLGSIPWRESLVIKNEK